jgi:hypothetical protein
MIDNKNKVNKTNKKKANAYNKQINRTLVKDYNKDLRNVDGSVKNPEAWTDGILKGLSDNALYGTEIKW